MARRSKRLRSGGAASEEEASIDLLALYEGDLGEQIISYASGHDLCTLDALSSRFQKLTAKPWKKVTKARFGLKNGKEGWKLGTSFLREPTYACLTDDGDFGYGDSYGGTARVASNGSILVAVTDDPHDPYGNNEREYPDVYDDDYETFVRTHPGERNGMGLRDAFTLNYIRTVPSPIQNCRVAICGWSESEFIVTSNDTEVVAQVVARRGGGRDLYAPGGDGDGIPLIGNHTHLIIGRGHYIEICELRHDRGEPELNRSDTIGLGDEAGGKMCLAWGPNEFRGASEFVVCSGDEIRIFSFRHSSRGNLEADNTWMIDDVDFTIQSVALTEAFVIGTSEDKKIHIWSRRTGELLHENLCDVEEQDEVDAGDIFHSLPATEISWSPHRTRAVHCASGTSRKGSS